MKQYTLIKQGQRLSTKYAETKPTIAESKGVWYEVQEEEKPAYNPETEVLEVTQGTYYNKWRIQYTKRAKTPLEMWQHPEYAKRITAPISLVLTDEGVKMKAWFELNRLPVAVRGENVELYCNVILPEHSAIVASIGESITIEDKPSE